MTEQNVMRRITRKRQILIIFAAAVLISGISFLAVTAGSNGTTAVGGNHNGITLAGKVSSWFAHRINTGTFVGSGIAPGDGVACRPAGLGKMFVSCSITDNSGHTIKTALVTVYNPDNWAQSPINVNFSDGN